MIKAYPLLTDRDMLLVLLLIVYFDICTAKIHVNKTVP